MSKIARKRIKQEESQETPSFKAISISETEWKEDPNRKPLDNKYCRGCAKKETCVITCIAMVACCVKYEEKKKKSGKKREISNGNQTS